MVACVSAVLIAVCLLLLLLLLRSGEGPKARALAFGSRATGGDAGLEDIKGTFDRAKRVHDKTKAMHDTAKEEQAQINEVKAA